MPRLELAVLAEAYVAVRFEPGRFALYGPTQQEDRAEHDFQVSGKPFDGAKVQSELGCCILAQEWYYYHQSW